MEVAPVVTMAVATDASMAGLVAALDASVERRPGDSDAMAAYSAAAWVAMERVAKCAPALQVHGQGPDGCCRVRRRHRTDGSGPQGDYHPMDGSHQTDGRHPKAGCHRRRKAGHHHRRRRDDHHRHRGCRHRHRRDFHRRRHGYRHRRRRDCRHRDFRLDLRLSSPLSSLGMKVICLLRCRRPRIRTFSRVLR